MCLILSIYLMFQIHPLRLLEKLVGACDCINGRHEECIIILLFMDSFACFIGRSCRWGVR